MTNNEITQYIKHYIEKDKTQNAIMLSGDWGIGKSHYIQHELVTFLQTQKIAQCVVISLYGMNSVAEISKSIYLELRAKKLQSQNEITATGKMMAKTVWKGITSCFGIDLSCSEEDMQKIADGIELEDGPIHADAVSYATDTDKNQVGIEIHSGRNRIVRRIFEALGYRVTKLDRVYFAGLTKKNLQRGRWRYLTQQEVDILHMGSFE